LPPNKRITIPPQIQAKLSANQEFIRNNDPESPVVKALVAEQKSLMGQAKTEAKIAKKQVEAVKAEAKAEMKQLEAKKELAKKVEVVKATQKAEQLKAKIEAKKVDDTIDPHLTQKYKDKIAEMFKVEAKAVEEKDFPIDLAAEKPWVAHFIGSEPIDLRMPRHDASEDWKPLEPMFNNMSIANHDASAEQINNNALENRVDVQEVMDLFPHPIWPPLQA